MMQDPRITKKFMYGTSPTVNVLRHMQFVVKTIQDIFCQCGAAHKLMSWIVIIETFGDSPKLKQMHINHVCLLQIQIIQSITQQLYSVQVHNVCLKKAIFLGFFTSLFILKNDAYPHARVRCSQFKGCNCWSTIQPTWFPWVSYLSFQTCMTITGLDLRNMKLFAARYNL